MNNRKTRLNLESLEARDVPSIVYFTWEGDVDNLFSTAGNWAGGVAPKGDGTDFENLVFPSGATSFTPQDDIPGPHLFDKIEFGGSGYTLSGLGNNPVGVSFLSSAGATNTLASTFAISSGAFSAQAGTSLTINSPVDLNGFSVGANTGIFDSSSGVNSDGQGGLAFNGVISDSVGGGSLRQIDGTVALGGTQANTYTGETKVRGGTLQLNKDGAVPGNLTIGDDSGNPASAVVTLGSGDQIADTSTVTINSDGKLDLDAFTVETIASLQGGGQVDLDVSGVLTINLTGTATYGGAFSSTGFLHKDGPGTLTLDGTSTHAGALRVFQGTLLVNGSNANSAVELSPPNIGSTLGGTGTVASVSVQAGNHLAPGDSPGILTTGPVTLNAGSSFDAEVGGSPAGNGAGFHDQLDVTGTVTLDTTGPGVTLNLTKFGSPVLAAGNNLLLVRNDAADAVTGRFVAGLGSTLAAGTVLTEGKLVSSNFLGTGLRANITYHGGTGNDIVLKLTSPPPPRVDLFAVATGPGSPAQVNVFNANGSLRFALQPFGGFAGGATVATGDVTGDGVDDIVVGAGPGAPGGHVKVFNGATGALIRSFLAFEGFAGGVFVGAGDITGDRRADIVVGAGAGGPGGHVKAFDATSGAVVRSFLAFPGFNGGVSVRAGDINGDKIAEIVVGAGPGGPPHIKIFDGRNLNVLASFFAGDPNSTGGVLVGVGNIVPGGLTDVVGSVNGRIRVFGFANQGNSLLPFLEQDNIIPFAPGIDTTPATIRMDNGIIAILVGATSPGTPSHVKVIDGTSNIFQSFIAFDPNHTGGINVG